LKQGEIRNKAGCSNLRPAAGHISGFYSLIDVGSLLSGAWFALR